MGSNAPDYQEIWLALESIVGRREVKIVDEASLILATHPDLQRRSLIRSQQIADLAWLHVPDAELPAKLEALQPSTASPDFHVKTWRRRLTRRSTRRTR
jgi:hypothetical protein